MIARFMKQAIRHRRYWDINISLIDHETGRRVQIALDNRYNDLVSVYFKKQVNNYYRVGSFKDLEVILSNKAEFNEEKVVKDMTDDGKVSKYGKACLNDRVITYTNFNYLDFNEEETGEEKEQIEKRKDLELIRISGILHMSYHEIVTRCMYMRNGIYVCIGFGNFTSRQGHEDSILLVSMRKETKLGILTFLNFENEGEKNRK